LKTRIYLANQGRKGLITCIHPPIDNELWNGIKEEYGDAHEIISQTHIIANRRKCSLIKVEELWQGNKIRKAEGSYGKQRGRALTLDKDV